MGIIRSDYLPSDAGKKVMHQLDDGKVVIEQQNDVEPILRMNHFLRSEQSMHHTNDIMNHVANIDVLALRNWCRQRGIEKGWWRKLFSEDNKLLKQFLNDPENALWRTRKGKI